MNRRRPVLPQNPLLQELKKYEGLPNKSREQRREIKKSNPFHYSLGEIRPVWKSWKTYAWNMGLLENEDE